MTPIRRHVTTAAVALALASTSAFATDASPLAKIKMHAVTASHTLITVSAAEPQKILSSVRLTGLAPDERILGIDYRVARGMLYALGSRGRLFVIDTASGVLSPVGDDLFGIPLQGQQFGFDFNPAADRIRIVSDTAQNLRAHPDTGALVDFSPEETGLQADGALAYVADDPNAGRAPRIVGAAYTYNTKDEKLTTNFAIDIARGDLVRQGSVEGTLPVVSPNTGKLSTVGSLGVEGIIDAHFDISDVSNTALAAFSTAGTPGYVLHQIDLSSGKARMIAPLGTGEAIVGIAIEP